MHAHWIEIFDGTDNHAIVLLVAHDLHLDFLPAQHALLDHDLVDRAGGEAASGNGLQLFHVVGHAAARAAKGEGRPDNQRKGQFPAKLAHRVHIVRNAAGRHLQANIGHAFPKKLPAFGFFNHVGSRADNFHAAFIQNAAP